ncbi:alpha/beta hydrolase [Roseovarius spongiae]|uniref:Alpha/beta hydrolase n=1 Tax=Roseovarius spongiae TaxID=2320272 RepID=A0A3A8B9Z5_9RHOB|nr:alpha/beta hydrolase [Roseovarius spongiae]RKF15275.1 alpha/beta hydrolase [Roseovarius spongiae]
MLARMTWIALGTLLMLIAGCAALTQKREREAQRAYPPVGRLIDVDGTRVHAWVRGSGPDLVLIHGAGGNLRDFTYQLTGRLTERYRVIAFDRPGLGWTGRLPGYGGPGGAQGESPQEQAALLQAAADRLGVRNPIVLGHSYGGAVALAWGLSRPDDTAALVLLAPVSNPWPGDLGFFYDVTGSALGGAVVVPAITALASKAQIESALEGVFAPQPAPAGYANHIGPGLTLRRAALRANGQQVRTLRPHIVEMSQRYRDALTMPVEILHGAADATVGLSIHSEVLVDQLRDARLTRLDGVGHMPHHADPAASVAAIDRAAARAGLR